MAGVTIGSAQYLIEVDEAGFKRDLGRAEGDAKTSAGRIGSAFDGLSAAVSRALAGIPAAVRSSLSGLAATAGAALAGLSGTIRSAFSGVAASVTASLSGVPRAVSSALSGVSAAARTSLAGVGSTVTSAFSGLGASVTSALGGIASAVTSALVGVGPAVTSALSGVAPAATAALSGVGRAVTSALGGITGSVASALGGVASAATSAMGNVAGAVTSALSGVPPAVAAALSGVTGAVRSALAGVPGAVQSALSGVAGSVTSALSGVTASISTALAGAAGAVGGAFTGAGAAITGALGGIGVAAGATGAAIAAGLGIGIKSAGDLEQAVANISTIKPEIDTSAVFASLNEMSTRVPQTAAQLGEALYNIFSSIDVNTKDAFILLETFAKGAVGAATDAETFGTAVLGVMNAYGLAAKDAAHISDVFFNTVNKGVVTGSELASSLGTVTQAGKAAGLTLDELGGFIVGVTKEGGAAAQNINNLVNLLAKITTDDVQKDLKALGIATVDATGAFRPLIDVMGDLNTRLAGMTKAAQANALQNIFPDLQARQAAQTILNQLDAVTDAIKENKTAAGSAAAAYTKMVATFNSQTKLLVNALRAIGTTIGAAVLPFVTPLVTAFAQALPRAFETATRAFGVLKQAFSDVVALITGGDSSGTFEGLLARLGLDEAAIGAVKRALADIGTAFRGVRDAVAPALDGIGTAFATLTGIASRLLVAVEPYVSFFLSKLAPAARALASAFGEIGLAIRAALVLSGGTGFTGFLAELFAQLSGLGRRLYDELVIQVRSIDWGAVWATVSSAGAALLAAVAGWVAGLATSLAGWIGRQVATINWATVWQQAVNVISGMAQWFVELAASLASWIGIQVAFIDWQKVWSFAVNVTSAMVQWFIDLAGRFAGWLGEQVAAIDWDAVWARSTLTADQVLAGIFKFDLALGTWLNDQIQATDWEALGEAFGQQLAGFFTIGTTTATAPDGLAASTVRAAIGQFLLGVIQGAIDLPKIGRIFADGLEGGWGIAIAQAAGRLLGELRDMFLRVLTEAWNAATGSWRPTIPAVTIDLGAFFGNLGEQLRSTLQGAWDAAVRAVSWHLPQLPSFGGSAAAPQSPVYYPGNPASQYAQGTNWVPDDQLAYLHRGEAVIPAAANAARSAPDGSDPSRPALAALKAIEGETADSVTRLEALRSIGKEGVAEAATTTARIEQLSSVSERELSARREQADALSVTEREQALTLHEDAMARGDENTASIVNAFAAAAASFNALPGGTGGGGGGGGVPAGGSGGGKKGGTPADKAAKKASDAYRTSLLAWANWGRSNGVVVEINIGNGIITRQQYEAAVAQIRARVEAHQRATGGNSNPNGYYGWGQYAQGTNYVPDDQLAYLHKGEAVIPARMNPSNPDFQVDDPGWTRPIHIPAPRFGDRPIHAMPDRPAAPMAVSSSNSSRSQLTIHQTFNGVGPDIARIVTEANRSAFDEFASVLDGAERRAPRRASRRLAGAY